MGKVLFSVLLGRPGEEAGMGFSQVMCEFSQRVRLFCQEKYFLVKPALDLVKVEAILVNRIF